MANAATATDRFLALERRQLPEEYNFEHFRTSHLLQDAQRTVEGAGIDPGELAPDFELPRVDGGLLRLSDVPKPMLLRFGSPT